jgi:site-specific DNA-methyltransferase (adenine-specific)
MVPSKHAGKIYSGTDRLTNGGFKRITPKAVNPLKCRGTVWRYATSNTEGNRLKLQHPATFPDKLAEDIILCFSQPGDIVLDPMCGSGTTCVMARNHQRHFIGIEISPEYCEIAGKRLAMEHQPAEQQTLF